MALTAYYVDSDIGTDTGAGTSGDPYGNIQHCLDTITQDTTNGDIIYGKGSETLGGVLDLTTYGSIGTERPLVLCRWGTDAWALTSANSTTQFFADSGVGGGLNMLGVDVNFNGLTNAKGMEIETGFFIGCSFHNHQYDNSNNTMVFQANSSGLRLFIGCHFYNCYHGVKCRSSIFEGCHFSDIDGYAVDSVTGESQVRKCTFDLTTHAAAGAIEMNSAGDIFDGNSVLGNGNTIAAVLAKTGFKTVTNNLIEGFSGVGGVAISAGATIDSLAVFGNAFYNNTADISITEDYFYDTHFTDLPANESLSVSPFAKSGANTFANRGAYYAPVDTGNVWGA